MRSEQERDEREGARKMAAEPFIIPAADAGLAKLRALALDRINTANITVTGEKLFLWSIFEPFSSVRSCCWP